MSTKFSKSAARNLAKYTTAGPATSLASKLFAMAVAVVALGVNLGGQGDKASNLPVDQLYLYES